MTLDSLFQRHWSRLVAVLARDTGDLGLAEDCVQEAFEAAASWGATPPENPAGWLYRTARNRAIDKIRRDTKARDLAPQLLPEEPFSEDEAVLGTILGCCHPALNLDAQIALTLRYAGGLRTEQIAQAFFVPTETMAKRLVRAKHKIRASRIPLTVPEDFDDRLPAVLHVIYLIYSAGYTGRAGGLLVHGELCDEAVWLAGEMLRLLPKTPEVMGLAALLEFTDARRDARLDADGNMVLLEHQDRSLWDTQRIASAHILLESAARLGSVGPYQVQAAIAAVHSSSASSDTTDWHLVVRLYRRLHTLQPSPVVALNLGCAIANAATPELGLQFIDRQVSGLTDYPYLPAARARLNERIGRFAEARSEYHRAIELLSDGPERRELEARLRRFGG